MGEIKIVCKDNVLKFLCFEECLICGKWIREDDKFNCIIKVVFFIGIFIVYSEFID